MSQRHLCKCSNAKHPIGLQSMILALLTATSCDGPNWGLMRSDKWAVILFAIPLAPCKYSSQDEQMASRHTTWHFFTQATDLL